jgi:hypothetical protein
MAIAQLIKASGRVCAPIHHQNIRPEARLKIWDMAAACTSVPREISMNVS